MKFLFCFSLVLMMFVLQAQENVPPTAAFTVEGKVKAPFHFSFQDAGNFQTVAIDSVVIYNHLLVRKRAIIKLKGILLKDILAKVDLDVPGQKTLNEYYFICVASDNYKVVFSWNELFNTETGKHTMIITEQNGKKGMEMDDRIALICPEDIATGRRYVKGLQKIIVERVK